MARASPGTPFKMASRASLPGTGNVLQDWRNMGRTTNIWSVWYIYICIMIDYVNCTVLNLLNYLTKKSSKMRASRSSESWRLVGESAAPLMRGPLICIHVSLVSQTLKCLETDDYQAPSKDGCHGVFAQPKPSIFKLNTHRISSWDRSNTFKYRCLWK